MTEHLLLFTIGPVQEFIAQARRTRDLWYGSHLLSELGRHAARALVDKGARLIFPALEAGDTELEPCRGLLRANNRPPLAVANKLLAEVPAGRDVQALARATRQSVYAFWSAEAKRVLRLCEGLVIPEVGAIWEEQVLSLLELSAAWVPLEGGNYAAAREALESGAAARKLLRDFKPWRCQRGGVPKSSLDGARETVLRPCAPAAQPRSSSLAARYRIATSEQLDAIGLLKRAGGEPPQFVPIANVAVAAWLALAHREANQQLGALDRACAQLQLPRVDRPRLPCGAAFGFDASVFFPSRWRSLFEEGGYNHDPEKWGREHVGPLLEQLAEPYPYVACLVADGDNMGKAISTLRSADDNRAFSRKLAEFAVRAREIVEQEQLGSLVYAGGDDVVAFLPIPRALAAADALRREFARNMLAAVPALTDAPPPTLSVGIGIGHLMEGMGELLGLGRDAERLAKGGSVPRGRERNALGVIVDKRSGGQHRFRARWDEFGGDPVGQLRSDSNASQLGLSSKKIYEINDLLRRAPAPCDLLPKHESAIGWAQVLQLEVKRALDRSGEGAVAPELRPKLAGHEYPAVHGSIASWVDRLLIARTLAAAEPCLRRSQSAREAS